MVCLVVWVEYGVLLQVGPALKALTGLLKNHSTALLGGNGGEASAPSTSAAAGGGKVAAMHDGDKQATAAAKGAPAAVGTKGTAAEAIARGVFDELHLPALSQSIRQVTLLWAGVCVVDTCVFVNICMYAQTSGTVPACHQARRSFAALPSYQSPKRYSLITCLHRPAKKGQAEGSEILNESRFTQALSCLPQAS